MYIDSLWGATLGVSMRNFFKVPVTGPKSESQMAKAGCVREMQRHDHWRMVCGDRPNKYLSANHFGSKTPLHATELTTLYIEESGYA